MKIILKPNESIEIGFEDSDGTINVTFGEDEISIESDLPDSDGKQGKIYSERFVENFNKAIAEATEDQPEFEEDDPTVVWRKGAYYVRQHIDTEKYHVFDKEGIAEGEELEHDHCVEFHDLKGAKQYIALQLKRDMERNKK